MSYALTVYLVPQATLSSILLDRNQTLLPAALQALAAEFEELDDYFDAPEEGNANDISHADALREIFSGNFTQGVPGARYGWAFDRLCGFIGKEVSVGELTVTSVGYYMEVDAVLQAAGLPLSLFGLVTDAPLGFPGADDFPCIGRWAKNEYAAIPALAALLPEIDDDDIKSTLTDALRWLKVGEANPDCVLIGVHG